MPFVLCVLVVAHCFSVIFLYIKFILYIVTALQPLFANTSDASQPFEEKHQRRIYLTTDLAELEEWLRMLLALWHRDGKFFNGHLKQKTIMSTELCATLLA